MASKHFLDLMDRLKTLHSRKQEDYAQEGNPFSNFERASQLVQWFNSDVDKVFVALIGVKLARIAELRKEKEPKNESLQDSFEDLTCYCGLWASYRESKSEPRPAPPNQGRMEENRIKSIAFLCCNCGREFHDRERVLGKDRKFYCSEVCRKLQEGSIIDREECEYCSTLLDPSSTFTDATGRKFCSTICRDKFWNNPYATP
jgi:hypothetical protein